MFPESQIGKSFGRKLALQKESLSSELVFSIIIGSENNLRKIHFA